MDIKNLLDNYLSKDTRLTERETGNGYKEVCDLDTGDCYTVRMKTYKNFYQRKSITFIKHLHQRKGFHLFKIYFHNRLDYLQNGTQVQILSGFSSTTISVILLFFQTKFPAGYPRIQLPPNKKPPPNW